MRCGLKVMNPTLAIFQADLDACVCKLRNCFRSLCCFEGLLAVDERGSAWLNCGA